MSQVLVKKDMCFTAKRGSPQEVTERLEKSMRGSSIRTDKEAARKFLSQLSMYDEKGQLKKEY